MKSTLEKILTSSLGLAFAALIILSQMEQVNVIPKNAKVIVDHLNKFWYPASETYAKELRTLAEEYRENDQLISASLMLAAGSTDTVTYEHIRKGGKYEDYATFPFWEKGDNSVKQSSSRSLLRSLIFGEDPRWDENGNWNY